MNYTEHRNRRIHRHAPTIDPETGFAPFSDKELRKDEIKREKCDKQEALEAQQEREQRLNDMRAKGASENAIYRATPGLREYLHPHTKRPPLAPGELGQLDAPDNAEVGTLFSEIETRPLAWLWQDRIPLGKITLLDGDPCMGKSLLAIHLAACVTSGQPMPDGTPSAQGGVILIASEDSPADTIKPRFEAAGGDPSNMLLLTTVQALDTTKTRVFERSFSLAHDLDILEQAITRMQATLLIIDPLMAVLGHGVDSSNDQSVRQAFTPLAQLAERTGCAILILRHLTKGQASNPLHRGSGSIGIIAAARTALLIAPDPDDDDKRILATTKHNLGRNPVNLVFQIVANERGIPSLQWCGENHYSVIALLHNSKQSPIRQDILRVLKSSAIPISPKDITNLTGQNYALVRQTLHRMHVDDEIKCTSRGNYIHLTHPDLTSAGTREIMCNGGTGGEASLTGCGVSPLLPSSQMVPCFCTRKNVTEDNITEQERDLLTYQEKMRMQKDGILNMEDEDEEEDNENEEQKNESQLSQVSQSAANVIGT